MKRLQHHGGSLFFGAVPFAMALLLALDAKGSPPDNDPSSTYHAAQASDSRETAVLKAAESQLAELLDSIPAGTESNYGFVSRDEFASVQLAQPYEMFSVANGGSIVPLEEWRVPIIVGNRSCALIDVRKSGNSYSPVGIGAAGLAGELGQMEGYTSGGRAFRMTQHKSILRSFKHHADFAVYDLDPRQPQNKDQLRARPLKSAHGSLSQKAAQIRSTGKPFGAPGCAAKCQELTMSDLQSLLDD